MDNKQDEELLKILGFIELPEEIDTIASCYTMFEICNYVNSKWLERSQAIEIAEVLLRKEQQFRNSLCRLLWVEYEEDINFGSVLNTENIDLIEEYIGKPWSDIKALIGKYLFEED
jgi:hypothetical protein